MLRGSIMIFVGILSVLFLKKKLEWFRWLGMAIIFGGLIVVGVSDFLQVSTLMLNKKTKKDKNVSIRDLIVNLCASNENQIFNF